MGIIKEINLSALSAAVLAKSAEFAKRMQGFVPSILCNVGHYSTEAFLLRSFVSLRADNAGDELAMTVDITTQSASDTSSTVLIESDICLDDGTIVAPGPSATFDASSRDFEADLSSWSKEFDAFLNASEVDATTVLHEMISNKNKESRRLLGF
jgi:hypothetical protein